MSADRPEPTTKAEVEARIDESRKRLDDHVSQLDEHTLTEVRDEGGWSVKDHLAHLAAWEQSMVHGLHGKPRHEGLGVDEETYNDHDVDAINAEIHAKHKDRPLHEVKAMLHRAQHDMSEALGRLTDHDLKEKSYSDYLPNEPGEHNATPMGAYVAGNTFAHYDEHFSMIANMTG
jgi:hypothetical protein